MCLPHAKWCIEPSHPHNKSRLFNYIVHLSLRFILKSFDSKETVEEVVEMQTEVEGTGQGNEAEHTSLKDMCTRNHTYSTYMQFFRSYIQITNRCDDFWVSQGA